MEKRRRAGRCDMALAIELNLSPAVWGCVYCVTVVFVACVTRAVASRCLNAQRKSLRDAYEHEMRGGGTVNLLLLPRTQNIGLDPRLVPRL
jgi:hypothetical protein